MNKKTVELSNCFDVVENSMFNYWSRVCKHHANKYEKLGSLDDACPDDSCCNVKNCWNHADYYLDFDSSFCLYHREKWKEEKS